MKLKDLAKRVKELRIQNGLSQEELALQSGLSLRTVQRIECCETDPREDSLKRLAGVLGETTDTLGWTLKENRGLLMMTNFSALSFILFPFLGILIPLFIWFSNKRTIKDLDKTAKEILNFQITWSIVLILWFLIMILKLVSMFGIGNFDGAMMGNRLVIQEIGLLFLYFYNFFFVIINAFRIDKGKGLMYFPAIHFFRIRK